MRPTTYWRRQVRSVDVDPAEFWKKIIPEEWVLIQQAIDGDSAAAEQIFGCHAAMLHRIAFRILHNKEDPEDAVQDSLCRAYAKLQSFQGRASFSFWLTRIVINSALMLRRRRHGRPQTSLDEILDARPHRLQREIVDAALDPEQICSGTEILQLLERQLPQLPSASTTCAIVFTYVGGATAHQAHATGEKGPRKIPS